MEKIQLIKLKWKDGDTEPFDFQILEQPVKTANILIKQHQKSKYPVYVSIDDAAKYGIEKQEEKKAPRRTRKPTAKAKTTANEADKTKTEDTPVLKTKEQVEAEKAATKK